jgi:hypothetical protein
MVCCPQYVVTRMAWVSPWSTLAQPLSKDAVNNNSAVLKGDMGHPADLYEAVIHDSTARPFS